MAAIAIAPRRKSTASLQWSPDTAASVLMLAKEGRGSAWAAIHREFAPLLVRFAASKGIRDREDIVQEVFMAAARNIASFEGDPRQFQSWLFTIAYRRCADYYRSRTTRSEVTSEAVPEVVDLTTSADVGLWESIEIDRAVKALEVLSEAERDVVCLRVLGEMDSREVARLMHMTPINVRVTQSRALARMRRHLEAQDLRLAGWLAPWLLGRRSWLDRLTEGLQGATASIGPVASHSGQSLALRVAEGAAMAAVSLMALSGTAGQPVSALPPETHVAAPTEVDASRPAAVLARPAESSPRAAPMPDLPGVSGGTLDPGPAQTVAASPEVGAELDEPDLEPIDAPDIQDTQATVSAAVTDTVVEPALTTVESLANTVEDTVGETTAEVTETLENAVEAVEGTAEETAEEVEETVEEAVDELDLSSLPPLLP